MSSVRTISLEEVQQHSKEGDAWVVINDQVYDISQFAALHPGGKKLILNYAGKDATQIFRYFHKDDLLVFKYAKLKIGQVRSAREHPAELLALDGTKLGAQVPYGDHSSLQGWFSPFFNADHLQFRLAIRRWILEHLAPHAEQWDENSEVPLAVVKKCGQVGILALSVGVQVMNALLLPIVLGFLFLLARRLPEPWRLQGAYAWISGALILVTVIFGVYSGLAGIWS